MRTINNINKESDISYKTSKSLIFILTLICILVVSIPLSAHADSDLYQFFEETQGETYLAYRYFSFIFTVTQLIVTLTGLLLLSYKVVTMACSFLVTVAPSLFVMIHTKKSDLQKKEHKGDNANTNDIFWYYLSYLIPDILFLSDFIDVVDNNSSSHVDKKWDHIPTIGEYFKKEIVTFVVVTLLGAMLFSGQTQRIVANFAKGGQALASKLEKIDIAGMVDSSLNSGKDFKFVFGNSIDGKNKKRLAESIYGSAKSAVPDARDSQYLSTLGSNIQKGIDSYISGITDNYSNPTLTFKTTFVENATNIADKAATDDGYGGQYGVKVIKLSSIATMPKNPPAYFQTGAVVVEYTAQKSSGQGQ